MTDWKLLIRELRDAKKGRMTKADIARALEVHPNMIREIENGNTKSPRYQTAVKLLELHRQRVRKAA
jgi:transcriptional regulator with XRE-family HTH domain